MIVKTTSTQSAKVLPNPYTTFEEPLPKARHIAPLGFPFQDIVQPSARTRGIYDGMRILKAKTTNDADTAVHAFNVWAQEQLASGKHLGFVIREGRRRLKGIKDKTQRRPLLALLDSLRRQSAGWRGSKVIINGGISVGALFVGDARAVVGFELSGADTGEPRFNPFLKGNAFGGFGPLAGSLSLFASPRGVGAGGSAKTNLGISIAASSGTPETGPNASIGITGLGSITVTKRGGIGIVGRVPLLLVSPAFRIVVEFPSLRKFTGALVDKIAAWKKRRQSKTQAEP